MTPKESSLRAREKRANLSSGLLVAKDIPSLATVRAVAARTKVVDDPAPEVVTSDPLVDTGVCAAADTPPPDTMLSRKGNASAAGFRPDYWSYDHRAAARALGELPAVVPLFQGPPGGRLETADGEPAPLPEAPAVAAASVAPEEASSEPPPAAAPLPQALSRSSLLVIAFGFFAVIASASLTWLAPPSPPAPAPHEARTEAAQPTPTPAVALPSAVSAPPEAVAQPSIVADLEPPIEARPEDSEHGDAKALAAATVEPVPEVAEPSARAKPDDSPSVPSEIATVTTAPPDRIDDDIVMPTPVVAAATPAPLPPAVFAEETAALVARGDQLLATGDIAAARLFYQRAAEQGSGLAALAIGKTNDPLYLVEAHVRGIRGDAVAAAGWYRRAAAAGEPQGQIRLDRLLRAFPEAVPANDADASAPRQRAP